jgi:hypothetical protein
MDDTNQADQVADAGSGDNYHLQSADGKDHEESKHLVEGDKGPQLGQVRYFNRHCPCVIVMPLTRVSSGLIPLCPMEKGKAEGLRSLLNRSP